MEWDYSIQITPRSAESYGDIAELQDQLTTAGQSEWELVQAVPTGEGLVLIYKRPHSGLPE